MDKILAARGGSDDAAITVKALGIYRTQTLKALEEVGSVMKAIAGLLEHESDNAVNRLSQESRSTITRVMIISIFALVTGIVFSVFMTRYITTRIKKLTNFCGLLADGDFTGRLDIDQQDEIGWKNSPSPPEKSPKVWPRPPWAFRKSTKT